MVENKFRKLLLVSVSVVYTICDIWVGVNEYGARAQCVCHISSMTSYQAGQYFRYLMKQIANAVTGTKTEGATAYMNRDVGSYVCPLDSQAACRDLDKLKEIYTQRALRRVGKFSLFFSERKNKQKCYLFLQFNSDLLEQ